MQPVTDSGRGSPHPEWLKCSQLPALFSSARIQIHGYVERSTPRTWFCELLHWLFIVTPPQSPSRIMVLSRASSGMA